MLKIQNKATKSYIVRQIGGQIKGRGIAHTPFLWRVGADSEEKALEYCNDQLDSTADYTVVREDRVRSTPDEQIKSHL